MQEIDNPDVAAKFKRYPENVLPVLLKLRKLIYEAAAESALDAPQETLKWGEPSYTLSTGSTVRLDWKPKQPDQYALYFHCRTSLIATFRELYGDLFQYESRRALVFQLQDPVPERAVKHCISLAFRYHQLKHLPLLGSVPV